MFFISLRSSVTQGSLIGRLTREVGISPYSPPRVRCCLQPLYITILLLVLSNLLILIKVIFHLIEKRPPQAPPFRAGDKATKFLWATIILPSPGGGESPGEVAVVPLRTPGL